MKWETETPAKADPREEWHQWFAWYPVTLRGTTTKVWLETIWRKGRWYHYYSGSDFVWAYTENPLI